MRGFFALLCLGLAACGSEDAPWTAVHDVETDVQHADGSYISWREHIIDDQRVSRVPLRGADALVRGHLDGDERLDILSVHPDSRYLRVAYSTEDPFEKFLLSLAQRDDAEDVTDVAVGDLNGDGWDDVVAIGKTGLIYFENPAQGKPGFRFERIRLAGGEGQWLAVEIVDLNGDGELELLALRPLVIGDYPSLIHFTPGEDALVAEDWTSNTLISHEDASFLVPGDLDGDGDLDIFAGLTAVSGLAWFRNDSTSARLSFQPRMNSVDGYTGEILSPVVIDLDGDERLDVAGALDTGLLLAITHGAGGLDPWTARTIGDLGPDGVSGLAVADIDGDDDHDLIAGSVGGGPRDEDADVEELGDINVSTSAGRIAWFANPGGGTGAWKRHDLLRRERGRFSGFIAADLDDDEDVDIIGVRSDSGALDGLFWLQQLHSEAPVVRLQPSRSSSSESRALPLP